MKAKVLFLLFLLISVALILLCLYVYAKPLHHKRMEKERIAKIQKVSMKRYVRSRDVQISERNCTSANEEITQLLSKKPLFFKSGSSSFENNHSMEPNHNKVVLKSMIDVLNHINEDVVLLISVHTDKEGSSQHNLQLSQKRADMLKAYIRERTHVTLITSIGYGEELPLPKSTKKLTNRRVEIILKRIYP